jgi:hypothetical protein
VFHDEQVAIRSLQKSSLNSCYRNGFYTLSTRLGEPSGPVVKLDTPECFKGHFIFSKEANNKSGLGIGDGVAEAIKLA